jgi:uncharacterized membrane protein
MHTLIKKGIYYVSFPFIYILGCIVAVIYAILQAWNSEKWLQVALVAIILLNLLIILQII